MRSLAATPRTVRTMTENHSLRFCLRRKNLLLDRTLPFYRKQNLIMQKPSPTAVASIFATAALLAFFYKVYDWIKE